jgi:hypothetical protein
VPSGEGVQAQEAEDRDHDAKWKGEHVPEDREMFQAVMLVSTIRSPARVAL